MSRVILRVWSKGGLTRDGTAEPPACLARQRNSGTNERGEAKYSFPSSADHKKDEQPSRLMHHHSAVPGMACDGHTYIHTWHIIHINIECGKIWAHIAGRHGGPVGNLETS